MPDDLRDRLTEKRREYDEAALAAVTDPSFEQLKGQLRTELHALHDEAADLDAAHRAAELRSAATAKVADAQRRKDAYTTAVARCGELGDLAGEIDDTLGHLRTLITRSRSVEDAWRSVVIPLVRSGPNKKAMDFLSDLQMRSPKYNEIEDLLLGLQATAFGPQTRARAQYSLSRIARGLGTDTPTSEDAA